MAKIIEFKRPVEDRKQSCSWCKNRNTHPMDPPCDKCKWYDRDTVFDLKVFGKKTMKVRKVVDLETLKIKFIPAKDADSEI